MAYDKHDIVYNIVVGTSFLSSYEVIPDYVSGKSCYVGQITEITGSPDCIYETRDKKLAEEVAHHFGGSVARSEKVGELINGRIIER
jgi:hypothetical protein